VSFVDKLKGTAIGGRERAVSLLRKSDFELREISKEEYERIKALLQL
jgi:hypothetical protein